MNTGSSHRHLGGDPLGYGWTAGGQLIPPAARSVEASMCDPTVHRRLQGASHQDARIRFGGVKYES